MKKIFYLFLILFAVINSLVAQTTTTPDNLPISTFPIFDNPSMIDSSSAVDSPSTTNALVMPLSPVVSCPIGTMTQPVTVGEYCTFLTDTLTPQNEPSLDSLKGDFGITADGPIACDGTFNNDSHLNNYNFYWDLNRSSEIIAAVPSPEVQQLFNNWRSNPYSQELLDYMIDVYYTDPASMGSKIGKRHTRYSPNNILQLYPNSTTLAKARNLALYPLGGQYLLYNERGVSVINPESPINPKSFISINRYQLPQPDYHRPVFIAPLMYTSHE